MPNLEITVLTLKRERIGTILRINCLVPYDTWTYFRGTPTEVPDQTECRLHAKV